jgi:hypothetical protein
MFGGTLFFVGLAAFFFFVYGRRKTVHRILLSKADAVAAEPARR